MTIAGEQDVPLENKERVEFVKGIAGVESGVASAGGLVGYVTKRPALVEAVDLATDHRGTTYGAVDLGRLFGTQKRVGIRLNLAGEKLQSLRGRRQRMARDGRGSGGLENEFQGCSEDRLRVPAQGAALSFGLSTAGRNDSAGSQ